MARPLKETVRQFRTKLTIVSPYDSAIVLLDISPTDLKTHVQTNPYTLVFREALFIIAKTQKAPTPANTQDVL